MKQTRFGTKVQNWHRPLGRGQLKQSFRTRRYDDDESMATCNRIMGRGAFVDDDCLIDDYVWWDSEADSLDVRCFQIKQALADRLVGPSNWFSRGTGIENLRSREQPSIHTVDLKAIELEASLAKFVHAITETNSHDPSLIQPAIGTIADLGDVVRQNDWPPQLATHLALFSQFWIRHPKTFRGDTAAEFVAHLLVRYDVIDCLFGIWSDQLDLHDLKWHCWLVLLGQGGSLKRVAERFGWKISKRFQSQLLKSQHVQSPANAAMLAEILTLGGSIVDYRRLADNPSFVIDPTDAKGDNDFREFWVSTVRWLITNRDELGDEETQLVLDWALHMRLETSLAISFPTNIFGEAIEPENRRAFSWKGRSASATVERSIDYLRQREQNFANSEWALRGWDWELDDGINVWTLTELNTSKQLKAEGRAMSHCVGGYSRRCVSNQSVILSMRCNDNRVLTIQVEPMTLQIMQAKGERNRAAHSNEMNVLSQWQHHVASMDTANPRFATT